MKTADAEAGRPGMISIALIGCGKISSSHVNALLDLEDTANLMGVCDGVVERAQALAQQYEAKSGRSPGVYQDAAKMLHDSKPDLVVIATGSGSHSTLAHLALDHGCHVVIEKPISLSMADARSILAKAMHLRKQIGVCFVNRFHPHVARLKRAIDEGKLGRILHGSVQTRWNRSHSYYTEVGWRGTWAQDGGTLLNQCTHGIDVLQWLMGGDLKRIHGVTRRFQRPIECEDFGCGIVEFQSGAVGVIEGSVNVYPTNLEERLSIFGERGTVVISGLSLRNLETWRVQGDDEASVIAEAGISGAVGHGPFYRDFLSSLASGTTSLVGLEQGLASLELILGLYKSMKDHKPVEFPLTDFSTLDMAGTFPTQRKN